jgi:hypothetical protein
MKNFLLIFILCLFCVSCGVKSDPEYKTEHHKDKTINLL